MKKSKVLATTALAGTLLFTGVGASHQAHAATISPDQAREMAKNYISSSSLFVPEDNTDYKVSDNLNDDYLDNHYRIDFKEKIYGNNTIYIDKDTGELYDQAKFYMPNDTQPQDNSNVPVDDKTDEVQKSSNNNVNNVSVDSKPDEVQKSEINETNEPVSNTPDEVNATDDNTNLPVDSKVDEVQKSEIDNTNKNENLKMENKNTINAPNKTLENDSVNSSLPNNNVTSNDTSATTKTLPETGEQSSVGLITVIASVLLAAGSLLTFRRVSKSK
ncbi:LPXTG cell wall anchor domain-containing protein [Staphylococcus haemolyticus]|uniref:LPXTG cell wall anchor domain-containing protein n=1 Tax=Staphylococcus haemolyticus TaxID=1283 RepID=UPI001F0B3595|nr:LPXTG cell wall anchor domain-containing protein [Staphylococcus haemolyticus]MCH4415505.1 LPXTG cell wall anchor domain-containing protein [Staphylococcus haemolyticus]MCH4490960.1 LPXTG cell wall anchor domain-containing protein [Staphylococcus haemolyticus]